MDLILWGAVPGFMYQQDMFRKCSLLGLRMREGTRVTEPRLAPGAGHVEKESRVGAGGWDQSSSFDGSES